MSVLAPTRGIVAAHHPLGASTGLYADARVAWAELEALVAFLAGRPHLPHRHLSVHGPVKGLRRPEAALAAALDALPASVDAIVLHPDTMAEPAAFASLGPRLALENMDARKATGRTPEELEPFFDALPDAGFVLDVAHVASVDPSMALGDELLDAFGHRLRHLHVSSPAAGGGHAPLSDADEERFCPLLARCIDVPWILEAPLPGRS